MTASPRRAVITGARGAVGAAVVEACVDAGYQVHAVQRVEVPQAPHVVTHVADLAEDAALGAVATTLARLDSLALLVHAAGAYERGSGADVFDRLFRINVRAPMLLTQALVPALRPAAATSSS